MPRSMLLLLALALAACRPSVPDPEPPEEALAPLEPPLLLRPPDGLMVTPFGRALDVLAPDVARLLYPDLLAHSAPAQDLLAMLPTTLDGFERSESFAGIQEGGGTSWVGAVAIYGGRSGRVALALRDGGWDAVAGNLFLARAAGALPDGRPISRATPVDRRGQHVQVGVGGGGRIVLMAERAGGDGSDLIERLAGIDPKPIAALEASTGLGRGAWEPSPKQPDPEALTPLSAPNSLDALLPAPPEGWTEVTAGQGYRRNDAGLVVAEASRTWRGPQGWLRASITDLGDPNAPVISAETALSPDEPPDPRAGVGEGGARCSEEFGSCKWAELRSERYLLRLIGPVGLGERGLVDLSRGFTSPG